ncbi:DUF3140 domain-containing protein [Sphingomonas sp.]|uniref:DUF3140 domain-containing protein n=1 Tax=Sphingomonas sp. TaxID=28214 RepID=UPI00286D852E|nr:DUF3140 domain-containing protein [Sphingomonas sp.]
MNLDRARIAEKFARAVNMDADELEAWLETPESRRVGFTAAGTSESVGHASGRRIVAILRTHGTRLSDDDYAHMRKVAGYVARHRAQEPANMVTSRWRYSLMNWGHDPLKEGPA